MNLETITDALSWYKIQPLNGYNLIRSEQKLLRRRQGVHESFSSRHTNRKSFLRTTHWNLENHVKIYHGISALQHSHRSETNAIAERAVRRVKEKNVCSTVAIRLGRKGGRIPWIVTAICEMFKTSYQMGEHRMKGDLENRSDDR